MRSLSKVLLSHQHGLVYEEIYEKSIEASCCSYAWSSIPWHFYIYTFILVRGASTAAAGMQQRTSWQVAIVVVLLFVDVDVVLVVVVAVDDVVVPVVVVLVVAVDVFVCEDCQILGIGGNVLACSAVQRLRSEGLRCCFCVICYSCCYCCCYSCYW